MIDRDKLYAYFEKFHGPIEHSSNGWYQCTCPVCGKHKLAVHFDYLIGKCWRGCYRNRFLLDIIQIYHDISYFETRELIDSMETGIIKIPQSIKRITKDIKLFLPIGYKPILSGSTVLANRARNYLRGRGFDLNYLDRIGVGYCDELADNPKDNYFGYIIIPFKRHGILTYFIGRDFIGNFERYKNPDKGKVGVGKGEVFFNEEAFLLQDKVYLTEGWACAATIGERGSSMQGSIWSVIQRNIVINSPIKELIIIPDAGFYANGLDMGYELFSVKGNTKKIKVLNLTSCQKEGLGKDVNEIGKDIVFEVEKNTPWVDMSFLYKEMNDLKSVKA
jgi:hypothetical protein